MLSSIRDLALSALQSLCHQLAVKRALVAGFFFVAVVFSLHHVNRGRQRRPPLEAA